MSLRYFSNISLLAVVPTLVIGVCVSGLACAAAGSTTTDPRVAPSVQSYTDQAVPVAAPASQDYYDSPLAAGTLTLEDVLEAHKPNASSPTLPAIAPTTPSGTATAPLLTPPTQSSSTSLMMSQGMKEVLQKVGDTAVTSVQMRGNPIPSASTVPQAQGQPASLVPNASPVPGAPDLKYEPGQEPKNLGASSGAVASSASASGPVVSTSSTLTGPSSAIPLSGPQSGQPSSSGVSAGGPTALSSVTPASSGPSCDQNVQKWEKNCGEAGYPATYVGKIVGETRTSCSDGLLHDTWVTNTCAPADTVPPSQSGQTNGACGVASDNSFDDAPVSNLCAQGIPSSVSGNGPWTWACSGMNGGTASACTAHKRVATVNGACGSANGFAASAAPSEDLCEVGQASAVKGTGPWTWSCKGLGNGSTQSCIAPYAAAGVGSSATAPVRASGSAATPAPSMAPSSDEMSAPLAASVAPSAPATPQPSSVSADKGELCGTAAETLAYEAPDKDLCRVGNANGVSGNGPWSWTCTDNEGRSSMCRTLSLASDASAPNVPAAAPTPPVEQAPSEPTAKTSPRVSNAGSFVAPAASDEAASTGELACGVAASQPTTQSPTNALCENGKPSAVHGSGPWHWTCTSKDHRKLSCETPNVTDGSCGAANGTSLKSAPFAGLCSSGTPTGIEGNGPWTWTCNGTSGGVNVSCAAALQQSKAENTKVEGSCGPTANTSQSSAPSAGLCASGTPSSVSGEGPWTWSCSGANGGNVSTCSAAKIAATQPPGPLINGLCGAANGAMATATPVEDLCSSGQATTIAGNGPWNWSCLGENGGMSVSCTAPLEPPAPVNGACGAASGNATLVKPQSALCSAGITGTVSGRGPWSWTCSGANGGTAASCVAPVAGRTGPMPSLTTTLSPGTTASVSPPSQPAPSSTGLVTPRLASDSDLPELDHEVLPRLTPSKSFASPPTASTVPGAANVTGADVPTTPDLGEGSTPIQPPALRDSLPSAPVLQETPSLSSSHTPGNHLTLDPTLSTVLFSRGSGNIDDSVITTLDRLSAILQENPDVRITLTAYADNNGSTPRDARRLSLTRALAVRDYLGSKGISDSRIDVRAEGANTTSGYIDRVDVKVNE